jgi:hypothetical protein
MGSKPSAADVRTLLTGYCIDANTVPDAFIEARRDNMIIPTIENIIRRSISGVQSVTEYCSGNGTNVCYLSRRGIVTLVEVKYVLGGDNQRVLNLANIELLADEGILKAKRNAVETWIMPVFPKGDKNLKITYTVGYAIADIPTDIVEAITLMTADVILSFIEGRSGGGDIGIQGYNKSYGPRGKYSYIRAELWKMSQHILRRYSTGVVG